MRLFRFTILLLLLVANLAFAGDKQPKSRTENVIVVTLDGFRFQEFFGGTDDTLLNKQFGGVKDLDALKKNYVRKTPEESREAILPFVWKTIAKDGQIFGDRSRKATTRITNGLKFSYPGYSELFCGFADQAIDSNAKKPNKNLSVLEFLHGKPAYRDRVAAFCTWDVFPYIFRSERSGLKVHAGWLPIADAPLTERQRAMNAMLAVLPRYWPDNAFDAVTMEYAREHLLRHKPRVLYIGLGETDEWGHGRRYDLYLDAARNADRYLAELWQTLQKMPEYKDKTSLLITTDHGRGNTRVDWTDHGKKVPLAEFIWIAVLGPDTPALGVRENIETTQSQVAATIAHLLGEDFASASPKSAPTLPGVRGMAVRTLKGHAGSVLGVAFSPNGDVLASCCRDKTIKLWDVRAGKLLRTLREHSGDVYGIAFSPKGDLLASGGKDKVIRLWDAKTAKVIRTLEAHDDIVRSVAFSPDQQTLASGGVDLTVRLWDVATGKAKQTLKGHTQRVMSVVYSPDGNLLASAGSDKTARIWDARTGDVKRVLEGHTGGLECIDFSPDSKRLVSSSQDATLRIWDVATGKVQHILEGHTSEIDSVSFSPNGKMIASGCKDKTIKLWDADTGKLLRTLTGHSGRIESLAFSRDGKTLATGGGGGDTSVRLWNLKTE